jgi:hypothetical protein
MGNMPLLLLLLPPALCLCPAADLCHRLPVLLSPGVPDHGQRAAAAAAAAAAVATCCVSLPPCRYLPRTSCPAVTWSP